MADWFRNKTWNENIAIEFEAKLKRSRDKPQYLKIQAVELADTKDLMLLDVAEQLISRLFAEYPDDKFNKASSLHTLGDIYAIRGDFDSAIKYYKQTLDFESGYPQIQTSAYLDYAELVVKTNKVHLYSEVEKYLLQRIPDNLFPVVKYIGYSILAIISKRNGNKKQAESYMLLANKYANAETSGLRYHKYLGIVKERDSWLDRLVRRK